GFGDIAPRAVSRQRPQSESGGERQTGAIAERQARLSRHRQEKSGGKSLSSNAARSIGRGARTSRMSPSAAPSGAKCPPTPARFMTVKADWARTGRNLLTSRLPEQQSQKGGGVENRKGHSRSASRRRWARKASSEASGFSPSRRR